MICQPCRSAADFLTNALAHEVSEQHESHLRELTRGGHQDCAGATACDCQHKVELQGVRAAGR